MEEKSDVLCVDKVIGKYGAIVRYNYFENKQQYVDYVKQYKTNPNIKNPALFFLQAVTIDDNNIIHYVQDSDSCIPVQFILVPQGKNFNQTDLVKYCNNIKGILSKKDGLKDKLDQEFIARILAAEPFTENGYINQLDLGLDEALVYAYIFTHTYPEIHEQIRLFDWERIDKREHGFLKDSLQPSKIKKTLDIKLGEEVYSPMIVHKEKTSKEKKIEKNEYSHISFTTVKSKYIYKNITDNNNDYRGKQSKELIEREEFIIKSFDTKGQFGSNEEYIKSQQTTTQTEQKSKE